MNYLATTSNFAVVTAEDSTGDVVLVPFQVLDADTGQPIPYTQYWYINENSEAISHVIQSDEAGKANLLFTAGIDNPESRWVNWWKEGYEPIVTSVAEVQKNYYVYLKKATAKKTDWGLIFAGTGLAITIATYAASKKKKSVGNVKTDLMQRYNKLDTPKKIALIGAGGLTAYLILNHFFGHPKTEQQKQELAAAKQQMKDLAYYGIFPSFPDAQYSSWVSKIITAVDDCGTNESAIYAVFDALINEADLYKLIIAYDVSEYKGCFEGSYFGMLHRTLSETLAGDLSTSEIGQINDILRSKQINYSF